MVTQYNMNTYPEKRAILEKIQAKPVQWWGRHVVSKGIEKNMEIPGIK